jgi:hypothetical protein
MAPISQGDVWKRLNAMADRLTHLEPVVDALREQANRTEARLDDFEKEARGRWEAHNNQMHTLKTDITAELHNLKTEQRVHVAVVGLVIGILSFLGITIGGWVIKSSLDSVRASINIQQR